RRLSREALAWVDAASEAAHLPSRADDAAARIDAGPGPTGLPRRARDAHARVVDAHAADAGLSGVAHELPGSADGPALPARADLAGRARSAVVDRSVAVVIEPVAGLGARPDRGHARERPRATLLGAAVADSRHSRRAGGPAPRADDVGDRGEQIVEVAVAPGEEVLPPEVVRREHRGAVP